MYGDDTKTDMLLTIAKYFPFSITDIENSYRRLKSFDKTIDALEYALSRNLNLNNAVNKIMENDNIKLGYYIKYKDPKDGQEREGLVIGLDKEMMIIWNKEIDAPYPIPRIQHVKYKTRYRWKTIQNW